MFNRILIFRAGSIHSGSIHSATKIFGRGLKEVDSHKFSTSVLCEDITPRTYFNPQDELAYIFLSTFMQFLP